MFPSGSCGIKTFLTTAAAELTGDHQGHSVSLIVVTPDNLTVVRAWVVGAETGDLHGSIQRVGSVSWQHDAAAESLIHLDYITFGTEREVSSLKVSVWHPAGFRLLDWLWGGSSFGFFFIYKALIQMLPPSVSSLLTRNSEKKKKKKSSGDRLTDEAVASQSINQSWMKKKKCNSLTYME